MIEIRRTNSQNEDFRELIKCLDLELAERDGKDHEFYAQFNKIDKIQYVVIAYKNNNPVACGAIKKYDELTIEIKRMYTSTEYRGHGIASLVLGELEKWANELSFKRCILETGIRQSEAIGLYEKNGYKLTPNYGQYSDVADSRCFEKLLKSK